MKGRCFMTELIHPVYRVDLKPEYGWEKEKERRRIMIQGIIPRIESMTVSEFVTALYSAGCLEPICTECKSYGDCIGCGGRYDEAESLEAISDFLKGDSDKVREYLEYQIKKY